MICIRKQDITKTRAWNDATLMHCTVILVTVVIITLGVRRGL